MMVYKDPKMKRNPRSLVTCVLLCVLFIPGTVNAVDITTQSPPQSSSHSITTPANPSLTTTSYDTETVTKITFPEETTQTGTVCEVTGSRGVTSQATTSIATTSQATPSTAIASKVISYRIPSTNITLELSPVKTWWDARDYCKGLNNGSLYIPEPWHNLFGLGQPSHYWVGAIASPEWKWTDNSSPFSYLGYMKYDGYDAIWSSQSFQGNSVALCYNRCYRKTYFGLAENRCFCLDEEVKEVEVKVIQDSEEGLPCPGNPAETCGDSNGMSVYKSDIEFSGSATGQCVYSYLNGGYEGKFEAGNCANNYTAICSKPDDAFTLFCLPGTTFLRCLERMCTTCLYFSWLNANKTCTLLEVTNTTELFDFMNRGLNYWIGLHRASMKRWIDGRKVIKDFSSEGNELQNCLSLRYNLNKRSTPVWIPCSEGHQALCAFNEYTKEKTEEITQHGFEATMTTEAEVTTLDIETAVSGYKYLFIGMGAALGLVICISALCVALFIKRKKNKEKKEIRARYATLERAPGGVMEQPYGGFHIYETIGL